MNLQIVLLPTESNIYLYLEIQKYIVVDGTSERWWGGRVWGGKKSSVADRQKKIKIINWKLSQLTVLRFVWSRRVVGLVNVSHKN